MTTSLDLFPPPRRIRFSNGSCASTDRVHRLSEPVGRPGPEAYALRIDPEGITLRASGEAGLFYAEQTLRQIREQCGDSLPCLEILDWPAYPARGFYHDVTRGKVPTLKTLLTLAETCAAHKVNQLQLYVEHTFAFRRHPEVWQGANPLTAEEILILDARCAELHIDLVPSFSTFGHFYTWIRKKFPELNELEHDVSSDPFCWWDVQQHYTLDCQNPASIELVREIITETRPLFRSRYYNICADETNDLGKGRNRAPARQKGVGRLYLDFVNQICEAVRGAGAVPMFWGDVIGNHPELLGEVPPDAILLDWDYSPELSRSLAPRIRAVDREFYVCPGVWGWKAWLPQYATAHRNITRFAKFGLQHGAGGFLNTDWGDYGNINSLGPSLPGLILGASAAWNPSSPRLARNRFEAAISRRVFGDPSGRLLGLLRQATSKQRGSWEPMTWCFQPPSTDFTGNWFDPASGLPKEVLKFPASVHARALRAITALEKEALRVLASSNPADPVIADEIRVGLLGLRAMEQFYLVALHSARKSRTCAVAPSTAAESLRELDKQLTRVWMLRNKPSELRRVRKVLQSAAERCESLG